MAVHSESRQMPSHRGAQGGAVAALEFLARELLPEVPKALERIAAS
jgi:hypothetical protein